MNKKSNRNIKIKITLAAILVSVILALLTFYFIKEVQSQLWEQSVNTIIESTNQGCTTLKVQLKDEFEALGTISKHIKGFSPNQEETIENILKNYTISDKGISLYIPDKNFVFENAPQDETVTETLLETTPGNGIIDPHISSVTGVNVFDLYVKTTMSDGTKAYVVKEYEVDSIVDSFTVSFYNDEGFSYVVNNQGEVLIRPPHPNSNKTVKNLFDMLNEDNNDQNSLAQFSSSLSNSETGWAVFTYQQEPTVFCYTPLDLQTDWNLISIIPQYVVNSQTNEILLRAFILIASIILGIILLVLFYLKYVNRTNRKLRNQAKYISHLYNAVPEGIALITVDPPYRFLQLNHEGLRLLKIPDNDSLTIKLKNLKDIVFEEDYKNIEKLFYDTALSGRKNIFEIRMLKSDGSYFWSSGIVEKTMDENGAPVLISAIHDITDVKLAEETLEREKLQERVTLVGAISNAYPVIINLNLTKDTLKFIHVKPGLMIDLGKEKTYSQLFTNILSTIHPDSIEEFKLRFAPDNLYKTLGQQKKEVFLEAKQLLKDNNYHWISTQIIYVDNPYSEDKLAILISRNINEQRHEEEQRRQALQSALDSAKSASEAKSRFLSNMSHDIRTPMNAIIGMAAIATVHVDDHERVLDCLRKINLSGRHLLSLINDVLDMSKIENEKLSLREEPFNFAELAADAVELLRPESNAKHLSLDINVATLKNEKTIGDPLRIRQVFINILSNAVKYTPDGGNVQIEVKQEHSILKGFANYTFRCSDTGIGMDEEFLAKLFLPFERANDTTTSRITGTGLGMAITKNIIDLMNGDIQVESSPGKGSVFTVTIPLRLQEAKQDEIPREWIGINTLLVDDDEQICKNVSHLLDDMGLKAQFTVDGRTAIKVAVKAKEKGEPFQLFIIDWKMPDMDGLEVTKHIRKEMGEDIPVIILSAYDWSEIENKAKDIGVTAFLSKPFYRSKICYLLNELNGQKPNDDLNVIIKKPDYSGKKILLVEDNEINREIAKALIEEMGIEIDEACDGQAAVNKISNSEEYYYDMILMDIQMPGMNGYDATKKIRSLKRNDVKHIPIIAMTANAFEDDARASLRAGMDAHFTKPIDINALNQLMHKYLID